MKKVLVLCTGNSCRSIIAEALINSELNRFDIMASSSGVAPSGKVNPNAIKALQEVGASVDGLRSKNLSEFDGVNFDLVVTVCDHANETCPTFFGSAKKLHCGFIDPSGKEYGEYVKTLNEIRETLLPIVKQELFGKTIKDSALSVQTN